MREVRWQLRTRLGVATLVVFDNRRILHGRTAVSSARHPRHLRGCYLVGARWLAQRFSAEVSEPVRLHVPAKRYLCATDSDYLSRLSRASNNPNRWRTRLFEPLESRLGTHRATAGR